MADKEKLSISIEAVDNFSKVFAQLNENLSKLEKHQSRVDPNIVDATNGVMSELVSGFNRLYKNSSDKLDPTNFEKKFKDIVAYAEQTTKNLNKILNDLPSKPINKSQNFNRAKKEWLEGFADGLPNDLKPYIAKTSVKATVDKKSIEQAQKEAQKELDKKPLKQKVEVETKKKETTPAKEVEKEPKQTKTKTTKPVTEPKQESTSRKIVKKEPVVTEVKTPKATKKETVEVVPKIDKKALQKEEIKIKPTLDTSSLKVDKKTLVGQEVKIKATVDTTSLKISKKDLPKEEIKVKAVVDTTSLKIDKKSLPKEEIKVKAVVDENSLKSSLSAAVSKLNQNAPVIKLVTKLNSSGILNELKDISTKMSKVEVPIAAKFSGFVKELKEQLKNTQPTVKVDARVNATNLKSSIQESLKNISTSGVEVPLKVTSRGLITAINNILKDSNIPSVNLSLKINQDKFDKSLGSIKTKLTNFISTVYKIIIVVNEERFQKSFDKVKNKVDNFISKGRKVKIDTDLRTISGKLQSLNSKISQLADKKIKIKYDSDIELKLIKLSTYINILNNNPIKIKAEVDKSVQNLNTLFSTLIKLNSMHIEIKEGIALASIKRVKEAIYGLKREVPKLQLDTSSVTVKNSELKTTANTLQSIDKTIKSLKSKKITYDFKTLHSNTVVKLLRNLQRELSNVNTKILISIGVSEHDTVQKLKEILELVRELRKSRYITISAKVNGPYARGYRGSRNRGGGRGVYDSDGERIYSGFTSNSHREFEEQFDKLRNAGRLFADITQFVGRSSKGFGSFLEALSKVSTSMINGSKIIASFGVLLSSVAGTFSILYGVGSATINTFNFFMSALRTAGEYIYAILKPGLELYKQRQSSIFSFTAAIQSNGILPNGKTLQSMGEEGREISRGLAKELINKATLDAELSAFSLDDLLTSLQGTLPILMKLGMSIDQAYKVNKGVAAVAKMIRLSPNQILQETRDIAQGSVTSRASQVANALGINNEDLQKYKGNADELFNYLMKKFSNYSELLAEYEDTAVGRFEQLTDRWKSTALTVVENIAPQFKGVFEMLIDLTGKWVDKTGAYINVFNNLWYSKSGELLDKVDETGKVIEKYNPNGLFFQRNDFLEGFEDVLKFTIDYIAQAIDGVTALIQKELGIIDPIQAAKKAMQEIVNTISYIVLLIVQTLKILYENREAVISLANAFINCSLWMSSIMMDAKGLCDILILLVKLSSPLAKNFKLMAKSLGQMVTGNWSGLFETLGEFNDDVQETWNKGVAEIKADFKLAHNLLDVAVKDKSSNTVDDIQRALGGGTYQGKFTEAVRKYLGQKVDGTDKGNAKGVSLREVKGDTQLKDNKNVIRESQKMLKEQLQKLKETLKDALGELKDILNKNKIAYDEGFMSIKDYFTQKANIEAQEAQLRLQEAYDEKVAVNKAQWDNEYDKQKELHRIDREIRQYARELGNAKTAISETNRALKESALSLNSFTEFMQNPLSGTQPRGNVPNKLPNGESIFGYTPPAEYNLNGMDTRYADFADMASGVETQLDGMNESVKRLLNIINKLYYEKTGERIIYTSFTGDLTGATENPHSDAKYGHRDGWKVDAYAENKELYIALHELVGAATRWENDHFDSSYSPASTYTGGYGTPYTTGEAWFNRLQESITNGIRGGNLDYVPGSTDSFHLAPNTTALSHEAQQALEAFNQKIQDAAVTLSENVLDIYSTNFGAGARAKINEIAKKYQKQIKEININMKNNPELKESYSAALSNLLTNMNVEIEDALVSYLEKRLSYNIEAVKTWGNYAAYETFSGRGMKFSELLNKYHKYFYDDENNPLAPSSVIGKMWESVAHYQSLGAVDKAQALRQKILGVFDEFNNIIDNYKGYVSNYFSNYKEWLNSTDATNLQKQFGGQEIDARYNEVKSNVLGMQIKGNNVQLEGYQKDLDGIIERLEEIDRLQKSADITDEEKAQLGVEKSNLTAQRDGLSLQRQKLAITNDDLKVQKLIADELKQQANYYRQLKTAAKQAIEDGLVHFLTDGINEAKNLGEALRNLATDFLKTMQKFFAERAVKGLMNLWFGKIDTDTDYGKQDVYAATTEYALKFGNNNAEINPEQFSLPSLNLLDQQLQQTSFGFETVNQSANNLAVTFSNLAQSSNIGRSNVIGNVNPVSPVAATQEGDKIEATADALNDELVTTSFARLPEFEAGLQMASSSLYTFGTNLLLSMFSPFSSIISLLETIVIALADIIVAIINAVVSIVNAILTAAASIVNSITTMISSLVNSVTTMVSSIVASVMQMMSSPFGWLAIKELMKGLEKLQRAKNEGKSLANTLDVDELTINADSVTINTKDTSATSGSGGGGFAKGGIIAGPGSSTSDSIPAMLSNGEAVLNAEAVKRLGVNFINAVNNGEFSKITARIPHFASGGVVSDAMQNTARGMTDFASNIGTNVSTTNQLNIALVKDFEQGYEHFMRSPKGQRILVDFNKGNSTLFSRFSNV